MGQKWLESENSFVKENYLIKSYEEIGLVLGRTEAAVSAQCQKLGFKKKNHIRHGLSNHPIYELYYDAHKRCTNPKYKRFLDWGGRGIKFLLPPVEIFIPWAEANGWKPGLSMNRIDNNGNYQKEQNNNQRPRKDKLLLTAFNETKGVREWIKDKRSKCKSYNTLRNRIYNGWNHEEAIITPLLRQGK